MGKGRACVRFSHASLPSSRNAACLFGPENRRGSLQNTKPPQAIQPMACVFRNRGGMPCYHPISFNHSTDATRPHKTPSSPSPRGGGSWSVGRITQIFIVSRSVLCKGATNHGLTSIASLVYLFGPLSGERDCDSIGMPSKRLYRLLPACVARVLRLASELYPGVSGGFLGKVWLACLLREDFKIFPAMPSIN